MNKRVLNGIDELLTWADYSNDDESKRIFRETYSILNCMETKSLTRQTKVKLANMGFRCNEMRFGSAESHDWATRSMQLDIVDNSLLRIGLGQDRPFTARWLEIPIKL